MRCPKCDSDTHVIDSRPDAKRGWYVYRRRACLTCGHRFTTREVPA